MACLPACLCLSVGKYRQLISLLLSLLTVKQINSQATNSGMEDKTKQKDFQTVQASTPVTNSRLINQPSAAETIGNAAEEVKVRKWTSECANVCVCLAAHLRACVKLVTRSSASQWDKIFLSWAWLQPKLVLLFLHFLQNQRNWEKASMRASHWKVRERERESLKEFGWSILPPTLVNRCFCWSTGQPWRHSFSLTSLIPFHLQLCVFAICLNGDNK